MTVMINWGYSRVRHVEIMCGVRWVGENLIVSRLNDSPWWAVWEWKPIVGWVIADTTNNKHIGDLAKPVHQKKLDEAYQDLMFHRMIS